MDARRTFELWRKVMREPALRAAIIDADQPPDWAALGLDEDDQAIAVTLRASRAAAYWPCEGYRYRVVDLASAALAVGAPLTHRIVVNLGLDLRALSHDFTVADGWRDRGHYAYEACEAFLGYLRGAQAVPDVAGVRDAIAVDIARCTLLRQVADLSDDDWARPAPGASVRPDRRYQRSPAAVGVAVDRDVGVWLQHPARAGLAPLPRAPRYFALSLPSQQVEPEYTQLGPGGRALFEALARPLSVGDGAAVLARAGGDAASAEAVFTDLLCQGLARAADPG